MKRLVKLMSLALVLTMIVGMVSACGSKKDDNVAEGKLIVIRCWNDEFAKRMRDHLPDYKVKNKDNALEGGTYKGYTIKFIQVDNKDNAYQNALDEALGKQSSKKGNELLDMFLSEADYAAKYVQADATADVKGVVGLTDADLANQYQYTKDAVTDDKGVLKGVSWQACPGGLIYNREIAKAVLGSDDPAEVQKAVADWDTFTATAQKMKEAGYAMLSGYDDTYRVFSNNVTTKWVVDGKINVDANIMKWVEQTKEFTEKGYNQGSTLWAAEWEKGFYKDGGVFCYFGPAWLIDFCMKCDQAGSVGIDGGWGITEGPMGFFWGGTWMHAATGTDNADIVKEIMLAMTCNETILKDIVTKDNDFANHKPAMEAMVNSDYSSKILGGMNPLGIYCNGASKIKLDCITTYDQGCNEKFQAAMHDYFNGNFATYEEAYAKFEKDIYEIYPALKPKN